MKYLSILALILLTSCTTQQPLYTPDTSASYDTWRQCRIQYEDTHASTRRSDFFLVPSKDDNLASGFATFMFGTAAGAQMNMSGPAMDKAVNDCMAQRGYKLAKPQ